jgi:hypothetical protein
LNHLGLRSCNSSSQATTDGTEKEEEKEDVIELLLLSPFRRTMKQSATQAVPKREK